MSSTNYKDNKPRSVTKLDRSRSLSIFEEAKALIPGGVNSPVRAFASIGTHPVIFKQGKGPILTDIDNNQYIDYVGSWGPMIHGHADQDIENAAIEAVQNGTSFGAPTTIENIMAKKIIDLVPSIDMVRMVNSGTEAVLSAIRLARAYTSQTNKNKIKIVKFKGCYHGHIDALLVQAGSGVATLGLPDSPGVTSSTTKDTLIARYNSINDVEELFKEYGDSISAIIVEPIAGNSGCIMPQPGFLEYLRDITHRYKALLIFDEVMTGFRVAKGGAQELFNIKPDLTTLGKVIGGGFPVGAYGGSKEIMQLVAPIGPMYQAGTLSGNPVAMSAGYTALSKLDNPNFFVQLNNKSEKLIDGLRKSSFDNGKIPAIRNAQFCFAGGMLGMFFTETKVTDFSAAATVDQTLFRSYYQKMMNSGIYLPPSSYEAWFMSASHTDNHLESTIATHSRIIKELV